MKLYTSYYSCKLIAASGLVPVRISLGQLRWKLPYTLKESCPLLMPRRDMLGLDHDTYRELYLQLLDGRGPEQIAATLVAISDRNGPTRSGEGRGLVLLCYESLIKPSDWCHRTLFAEWIQERLGLAAVELGSSGGGSGCCSEPPRRRTP